MQVDVTFKMASVCTAGFQSSAVLLSMMNARKCTIFADSILILR